MSEPANSLRPPAGEAAHIEQPCHPWHPGGVTEPEQTVTAAAHRSARVVSIAMILAGVVIAALSLTPWGITHEGVQPTVTGLGGVDVPGASNEDVAFLTAHTQRPGNIMLVLGAITAVVGGLGVWRSGFRLAAGIWGALAGIAVTVWAIMVLVAPERRLFDDRVNAALDGGATVLQPGWGLLGEVVAGAVLLGLGCAQVGVLWMARR